ncbi:hypothetical protein TNIN_200771 [Trichonephila inaurata madagascariensis]|uniref:EB domain-containing protein n=1 Tax=Trichonephila inaurata madagascariensis TaxID=2747483 RepID=A0A8X6MEP5_9ARAC|nr:hypothetical protein TNIN_200771 [Trichonephila inaurata madagascariensis]
MESVRWLIWRVRANAKWAHLERDLLYTAISNWRRRSSKSGGIGSYLFIGALVICFCIWKSFADEGNSEISLKLGEKCRRSEQCQNATPNSTCSDGICMCQSGFFPIQSINSSLCESIILTNEQELEQIFDAANPVHGWSSNEMALLIVPTH